MLNGLQILVSRMETHPEEFVHDGKWTDVLASIDKHLTEEEKAALKQGYADMARSAFNEVVLRTIAGENVDFDLLSTVGLDYDSIMLYPVERRKMREEAERQYREQQLEREKMMMEQQRLSQQRYASQAQGLSGMMGGGNPYNSGGIF